jgi:hypothetical protein
VAVEEQSELEVDVPRRDGVGQTGGDGGDLVQVAEQAREEQDERAREAVASLKRNDADA